MKSPQFDQKLTCTQNPESKMTCKLLAMALIVFIKCEILFWSALHGVAAFN